MTGFPLRDLDPDVLGNALSPMMQSPDILGELIGSTVDAEGAAQGWAERLPLHAMNAATAVADATAHLGTLATKVGAGAASFVTGNGFGAGYSAMTDLYRQKTGTGDPGFLDLGNNILRAVGLDTTPGPTAGVKLNSHMRQQLGNQAVYSQTVGNIISMGSGVGAQIANGAAAAAGPLSKAVGKALAKTQAKKAGMAPDAFSKLADQGRVWDAIASSPEWLKSANLVEKVMVAAGRRKLDLLGNAAGNVAQSYALAPDDERLRGALAAAMVTPFAVPVARLGQAIAGKVLAAGLTGEAAERATGLMRAFGDGEIGARELDEALSSLSSRGSKIVAGGLSSVFEGTAFSMLQPESYDELSKFLGGDMDAGARLVGMMAATAGGVAALRGMVPMDMAPMFRTLRPDLNTLDLYMEAEANARRAKDDAIPKMPPGSLVQDPVAKSPEGLFVDPTAPLVPEAPPIQESQPLKPAGERTPDGVQFMGEVDPKQMQMEQDYGWAAGYSDAPLKSGFQPEFQEGGKVRFQHGRDFSFAISPSPEGLVLQIDPKVSNALREAGLPMSRHDVLAPTMIEFRGAEAEKTVRDLALLARLRMMDGAIQFQKTGMVPSTTEPWAWRDTDTGETHMMQLDGTTAIRGAFDGAKWTSVDGYQMVGGEIGPPKTDINDLLIQTLSEALVAKNAIAPDSLVDSTIGRAITIARFGEGVGADNLREYFRTQDPAVLMARMQPGQDVDFAMQLGAIATGFDLPTPAVPPSRAVPDGQPAQAQDGIPPSDVPPVGDETALAMSGIDPRPAAKALGRAAKADSRIGGDYLFETHAEVISKNVPDTDVGYRGRAAMAQSAEITGRAVDEFKPAQKALKTKEGRALRRKFLPMEGDARSEEPAFLELADNRREGATPVERQIQAGFQRGNASTWNAGVEAGLVRPSRGPDGKPRMAPMETRPEGTAKQPRELGKDFQSVMDDAANRMAYFESLVNLHPDLMTKGDERGERRRLTAADLDKRWKEVSSPSAKSLDRENAVELMREFNRVPYRWKDNQGRPREMFESNPFQLFSKSVTKSAGRIATAKQFGQDLDAAARKALLDDKTLPDNVRAQLQKGGLLETRKALEAQVNNLPDASRAQDVMRAADEMFARLQSSEPVKPMAMLRLPFLGSSLRNAGVLRSSYSTAKTFLMDIPEMFAGRFQAMAGLAKSYKAIREVAGSPSEMIAWAQRSGAIDAQMGDWVWSEASSWAKRGADFVGIPSQAVETLKGAIAARIAKITIDEIKAGKVTIRDLQLAQDLLRLSPEQIMAIKDGQMDASMERQFLREYTQMLTSRVKPVEGSQFAANPNVTAVLAFTRWATNRTMSNIRMLSSVFRSAKRSGWGSAENRVAMGRVVGNAIGMGSTYLIGRTLSDLVVGLAGAAGSLLSGQPTAETIEDGFKKVWRELAANPVKETLRAVGSQTTGGPFMQAAGLVGGDWDQADSWARLTHPSALAFYTFKHARAALSGDFEAAWRFAQDAGFVPLNKDLKTAYTMMKAPMAREAELDGALISDWKRRQGIDQRPRRFDSQQREFYDVLAKIREFALENPADPKAMIQAASDKIREAMGLKSKGSLASSVAEMQLMDHLTDAQRGAFAEFLGGDEERLRRIYRHDQVMRDLASEIRKLPSEAQAGESDWAADLDAVRSNAAYGADDRWSSFTARTLDELSAIVASGGGAGSRIEDLASAMSIYPRQLEGAVGAQTFRQINRRGVDAGMVQRLITMNLNSRLRNRVAEARKQAVKAQIQERR